MLPTSYGGSFRQLKNSILNLAIRVFTRDWGLGIGDWGLGTGD
ncbi:hypothetical protein [Trichocoleus sp. FACHB-90]|nr:hypothetical protein [Trichocoleus sp. FACHB-90]